MAIVGVNRGNPYLTFRWSNLRAIARDAITLVEDLGGLCVGQSRQCEEGQQ